jgi:hypothetical protein
MGMEIAANWDAMRSVWWKFAGVSEEATASIFREQENTHDLSFRTEEIEKVSVRIASWQTGI